MQRGSNLNDFLLELGVEELPVAAVSELSVAIVAGFQAALAAANISHGDIRGFGAPRRLALLARDVAEATTAQVTVRRGPALSKDGPDPHHPAVLGFAKSCGVAVADLEIERSNKGAWWTARLHSPAIATATLLPSIVQKIISELPIRKLMRWGAGDTAFVRPLHWAVMIWGNETIETEILGVVSGRTSYGHRFLHPGPITLRSATEYEEKLRDAYVIADFQQRQTDIRDQINAVATLHHLTAVIPDDLLAEVTAIVEWPRALIANFDPKFLAVPAEALISAMQIHQKSFALYDRSGKIAPQFIAVANLDHVKPRVKLGNEKVMQARLADAAFFYAKDRQLGLASHIPALTRVVYQNKLGSLADKADRIARISASFQQPLNVDAQDLLRAAALSKCDLLSGMVGEFPELQGVMGYHYALDAGESVAVAVAVREQYLPRFAQDALPSSALGTALSIADRLDTLYGLFAIGQKPTGVKDPFKLRRHALAIARLYTSASGDLSLRAGLQAAANAYADYLPTQTPELIAELHGFILERLQSYYQSQQIPLELFHAVRACQDDCLFDLAQRISALVVFIANPNAAALAAMAKRVTNLLTQAPAQSDQPALNPAYLTEPAEHALWEAIQHSEQQFGPEFHGHYSKKLAILVAMQPLLATFFEQVMVRDPDLRLQHNRLALLQRLQGLLVSIADLSYLAALT